MHHISWTLHWMCTASPSNNVLSDYWYYGHATGVTLPCIVRMPSYMAEPDPFLRYVRSHVIMFDFYIRILCVFTVSSSSISLAMFCGPLLMAVYLYGFHIDITIIKCKGLELKNYLFARDCQFVDWTCSDAQFWIVLSIRIFELKCNFARLSLCVGLHSFLSRSFSSSGGNWIFWY